MKFIFAFLILFPGLGLSEEAAERKIKINPADYTCTEFKNILAEYRSVWIPAFLGYNNLAASSSEIERCSGAYTAPFKCNYWTPNLRTKNGTSCKTGIRCACFNEHVDDD